MVLRDNYKYYLLGAYLDFLSEYLDQAVLRPLIAGEELADVVTELGNSWWRSPPTT